MKTLFFALGALALVGCSGLKPVGPLAKDVPITQQGKPIPGVTPDPAARAPAVRPTPPTMYVTPGDVNPDNPYLAAGKLSSEIAADSKATSNAPVTAEVSRIQGRVK
jgi:hypothetical protein